MWGCWVETQASIPSAVGRTRIALPSIGAVAMRWLTIRTRVTWSASSRTSSPGPWRARKVAMLEPISSNCERGAVGQRLLDVGDGRQVVVVDVDQLGGVHRLRPGLGDDQGDRVAGVAHLVDGQRGRGRLLVDRREARQGVAPEVVGGVDGQHALGGRRRAGVDAGDAGVGEGAADEDRVRHALAVEVVDEGALPEQQLLVLDAADLCSKDRSRHGNDPTP